MKNEPKIDEPKNTQNLTAYKRTYNRHRRRPQDPNFSDDIPLLVDFCDTSANTGIVPLSRPSHAQYKGPIFGFQDKHPGFIYIPQALSKDVQLQLAYQSVSEFCEKPHRTNIDMIPIKESEVENQESETMWNLWKDANVRDVFHENEMTYKSKKQKTSEHVTKSHETRIKYYRSMDKLAWATHGYHYDWTARAYNEGMKSPMPNVLSTLGSIFASVDPACNNEDSDYSNFNASATIVNYYTLRSNMGGHRDDLELDFTKPVVSLSLGLPAVFLLGGKTKEDEVTPILVRPGDVMLLAGDSRLAFHGMARVIPEQVKLPIVDSCVSCSDHEKDNQICTLGSKENNDIDEEQQIAICRFLKSHRININIRQVLPHNMKEVPSNEKHL